MITNTYFSPIPDYIVPAAARAVIKDITPEQKKRIFKMLMWCLYKMVPKDKISVLEFSQAENGLKSVCIPQAKKKENMEDTEKVSNPPEVLKPTHLFYVYCIEKVYSFPGKLLKFCLGEKSDDAVRARISFATESITVDLEIKLVEIFAEYALNFSFPWSLQGRNVVCAKYARVITVDEHELQEDIEAIVAITKAFVPAVKVKNKKTVVKEKKPYSV